MLLHSSDVSGSLRIFISLSTDSSASDTVAARMNYEFFRTVTNKIVASAIRQLVQDSTCKSHRHSSFPTALSRNFTTISQANRLSHWSRKERNALKTNAGKALSK